MNNKQNNLSCKAYYDELKKEHLEVRDRICDKLGISVKTFYNKINNSSFSEVELEVVASILNESIINLSHLLRKLFPETKNVA